MSFVSMQERPRFFEGGELPRYVMAGDEAVVLNTDFRVWLDYARIMESGAPDAESAARCIEAAVGGAPPHVDGEALGKGLAWFYSCGDNERLEALNLSEKVRERKALQPALASLYWDFWQVWASFKGQYGIDLYTCGAMHWWEFVRLLEGLKGDAPFAARRSLRGMREQDVMHDDKKAAAERKRVWGDTVIEKYYLALPGAEVVT